MSKSLLIETNLFEATVSKSSSGKLLVAGVLQRAGAKNQNGRVYPREILEREVENYQQLIDERRALGELDHPDSSVVNLQNVSHNIIEIGWDGDDVIGKVEILPTPSGNILKNLFESDIRLGISSRGMGSVKENGDTLEVQEDFNLIAFDFVSNPSTHGAFMNKMNESVSLQEQYVCDKYCKTEDLISKIIMEMGTKYDII
jgi:hypothetical protein